MTQEVDKNAIESSDGELIVATALRTLYVLLITLALVCTVARLLFPMSAMKFYDSVGNEARAYDCANDAVSVEKGEDKVNARLNAMIYAIRLTNEDPSEYAPETIRHTKAFLSDSDCRLRLPLLDEHNLSSAPAALHPGLYSYECYLYERHAHALAALGEKDKLLLNGSYYTAAEAIALAATPDVAAIVAASLAAAIEEAPDFVESLDPTPLKTTLTAPLEHFETNSLQALYYLKCYEKLVTRMIVNGDITADDTLAEINYNGAVYEYDDLYYHVLLPQYSK